MDLLSPCRSCLQCLPFFHVSPPSSPRRAAAPPLTSSSISQEALKGTESLPCPDTVHATQAQGVCPYSEQSLDISKGRDDLFQHAPHFMVLLKGGGVCPYSESLDISKGSDELCKGDDLFQHAPHHNHDSAVALPTSSLDTSSPELDMGLAQMEPKGDDDCKASPSQSEVLGGEHSASAGRRHRELLQHQLKGIKQQIKQGGLQIKEEGGKHVQIFMENVSKHAQQIEGSGSFSRVLRINKN